MALLLDDKCEWGRWLVSSLLLMGERILVGDWRGDWRSVGSSVKDEQLVSRESGSTPIPRMRLLFRRCGLSEREELVERLDSTEECGEDGNEEVCL